MSKFKRENLKPIKLYPKLIDTDMWLHLTSMQRELLVILLLLCNKRGNDWEWKGQVFKANPGQIVTSLDSLRERCAHGTSTQNVRTALKKLEKWKFLTNESTKTGRLITIVKYNHYQDEKPRANKATDKQLTKPSQRPNKELTPIGTNSTNNTNSTKLKDSPLKPKKKAPRQVSEREKQVQEALDYFFQVHLRKKKVKYDVEIHPDKAVLRVVIGTNGLKETKYWIDEYFRRTDLYWHKQGCSVPHFRKALRDMKTGQPQPQGSTNELDSWLKKQEVKDEEQG